MAKISIDGGKTYCTVEQALIAHDLETWMQLMDPEIGNQADADVISAHMASEPECDMLALFGHYEGYDAQYLARYLELSPVDLIIG